MVVDGCMCCGWMVASIYTGGQGGRGAGAMANGPPSLIILRIIIIFTKFII